LDFSNMLTLTSSLSVVNFLSKFSTIIWDGDSLASDSFTHLIEMLVLQKQSDDRQFIAFIKENSQSRFRSSWSTFALNNGMKIISF
jgi:hypothetical protein